MTWKEAMMPEASVEPRTPLSKERVLDAAIALADENGIESLTMRKLAEALGVEAMSLYYHVANKDVILDGMVDQAFSEIELTTTDADWKLAMRDRAISVRKVLSLHPWAITLMQSRTNPGPAVLHHHDSVIGTLRRAGFSVEMTAHAFSALDAYIYGFVAQELSLPFDTSSSEEAAAIAEVILETFPTEALSYLAELTVDHVMQPGYNYADEFVFGLDLILDSLEWLK
jgi:AcrR family transcriptional regulator